MIKIILFFFISSSVFTETIFLRNGSIYKGKIKTLTETDIVLTIDGTEKTIPRSKSFKIIFKDLTKEESRSQFLKEVNKLSKAEKEKLLKEISDPNLKANLQPKEEVATVEPAPIPEPKPQEVDTTPKPSNEKKAIVTKWSYILRSAVLPGWGHIHAKQYKTGIFYSLVFLGGLAFTASAGSRFTSSNQEFENSQSRFTILALLGDAPTALVLAAANGNSYATDQRNVQTNQALFFGAAAGLSAFYVFQLSHAYIMGTAIEKQNKSLSFDFKFQPEVNPALELQGNRYDLGFNYRF
ncbi:MAG: DUF5683 domain-containing protein [Leptospiraceae bacterium]|nr:DUF5683 domain-containing protein [Leptospiraceae bacterium]